MKPLMNLEELQETVGLLENDEGIVHLSLFQTDLWDLLQPYIPTVDYRLYFDYANRIVIGKYAKLVSTSKLSLLKKAIYYALKGEEYNLQTLINTTKLDYNPLENYELHETVVTTASIAENIKIGEVTVSDNETVEPYDVTTKKEYAEDKVIKEVSVPTKLTTKQFEHAKQVTTDGINQTVSQTEHTINTDTNTTIAELETTTNLTDVLGKRTTNNEDTNTVAPYDTSTFINNYQNTGETTQQTVTDTHNTIETVPEHKNNETSLQTFSPQTETTEATNTKTSDAYTDSETTTVTGYEDTDTSIRNPRTDNETVSAGEKVTNGSSTTNEHENNKMRDDNINRQRDLHGRYGFNTVQTMIESERRLANLNVSDRIIDIIIHTICEGVLYLW